MIRAVFRRCGAWAGAAIWGVILVSYAPTAASEPPAVALSARHDRAWADATARYAQSLLDAGLTYRAAQWALYLAEGGEGIPDPRAAELMTQLPPRRLSDGELLYLGCQATARGSGTAPALLALGQYAHREGRPVTHDLLAAARALGADSAAVAAVAGMPIPPRPLALYTIGVLAPINGRMAFQGESFAAGAALAIAEHNRDARFPLMLEIGDTQGDPIVGARAAGELARHGVGAMCGTTLLTTTVSAAAAAAAAGIPLVTPAAGRDDLGSIGPGIFQAVPPRELQAEALARAAVRDLGYQRLAVLTPDTPEGQALADRFAATVGQQGGAVVGREVYRSGDVNFGAPLERLRELLPDAVFMPGSPRELMSVIPQLTYYEVGARLLALEEMAMKEVADVADEYLDEAVFAASYYGAPALGGETFAERFRGEYRRDADVNAIRGYVSATLVAQAMSGDLGSSADIRQALAARARPGSGILNVPPDLAEVQLLRLSQAGIVPIRSRR